MTRWMCMCVAAAMAFGCGGTSESDGGGACAPPSQKYPLSEAYLAHACLHVTNGPFETHAADPVPASTKTELRNTHYAYTVELPEGGGAVYFEPRSTEGFAFFRDVDAPFTVQSRDGRRICPVATYEIGPSCPGFRRVDFYDLERKAEYPLVFGPTPSAKVLVLIEAAP